MRKAINYVTKLNGPKIIIEINEKIIWKLLH